MNNDQPSRVMASVLLDRCPVLPASLLRAAWASAVAAGDLPLMRTLVAREDAPEDLIAQFATQTEASVVGVYAARHTKAPGWVADHRAAALAKALAAASPPQEAIVAALAAFDRKPTRTLAGALLRIDEDWLTPEQAFAVLTRVSPGDKPDYRPINGWRFAARLGPELGAQLLRTTRTWWVMVTLLEFDLPTMDKVAAVARCSADIQLSTDLMRTGVGNHELARAQRSILERSPVAEHYEVRITFANPDTWGGQSQARVDRIIDELRLVFGGVLTVPPVPWDTTPTRSARTPPLDCATPAEIEAAAASPNPGRVHEAAQALWARLPRAEDIKAYRTLLSNPALTRADCVRLLSDIASKGTIWLELSANGLAGLDLILTHPGDEEIHRLWAAAMPAQTLARHGWEPFGGRTVAPGLIRSWQVARAAATLSSALFDELLDAVVAQGVTAHELRALSVATIQVRIRDARRATAVPLATAVADLLAKTLGDDPACWAVYDAMAGEAFTGSLGELLDTITQVTA